MRRGEPAANTRTSAPAPGARPWPSRTRTPRPPLPAPVARRSGEREIEIAVAVDVGPLHAVVRLQRAQVGRGHVFKRGAGVPKQRVLPADAAGHGAVDVEVEPA